DAGVRIVDMRQSGYAAGHVPGAVHLSPVAIRDANAPPTFLPTTSAFEAMMTSLGIGDGTRVVVYDERGGIYAARLWWILDYFGHSNVALVNGGLIKWTAERLPHTREPRAITPPTDVIAYGQVAMPPSVDLFALHLIGYDKLRNYYSACEEWGNRDDLPIATKTIKN